MQAQYKKRAMHNSGVQVHKVLLSLQGSACCSASMLQAQSLHC